MANSPDVRRRSLGGIFLVAALAMLIAGQTVLQDRLGPTGFIFFWLGCFVFTGLALLVAILDFSAVRRRTRKEQLELFENTLKGIEQQKESKSQNSPGRPGNSE
jgi:drug/metabolite transporter (DMT)-like permease